MGVLWLKIVRDLWWARLVYGAVVILLALGVGLFASLYSAFENLERSEAYTYERLSFADAFFIIPTTSRRAVNRVENVDGVKQVEGRFVQDVPLRRPDGSDSSVVARLISLPDEGRPAMNDVKIIRGAYLPDDSREHMLVDDLFAEFYGIDPGDEVTIEIEGKRSEFAIAGTFTSPEYLWKAKNAVELFVPPGEFAIVLARKNVVDRLLDVDGMINEMVVTFDANTDHEALVDTIDDMLDRYGTHQAIIKDDQLSYQVLKLDLEGFGEIATAVPVLFMFITGLVMYAMLSRTVQSQRSLIGLLRAEGFSRGQVVRHYLSLALLVALVGGLIGVVMGLLLGRLITNIYVDTLGLPFTLVDLRPGVLLIGLGLSVVVCLIAALRPALAAASVPPSHAMRPEVSLVGGFGVLDKMLPVSRFPYPLRLALRNMGRARWRTVSSVLGVTVSVALIFTAVGMLDSVNNAFDSQFDEIERYNIKTTFTRPMHSGVAETFDVWPEVARAEPIAEIPAKLINGDNSTYTVITGLSENGSLLAPRYREGRPTISGDGIFLSNHLARALEANVGDLVEAESPLRNETFAVVGIFSQPLGDSAFMSLDQAATLLRGQYSTGAMLRVEDPADFAEVKDRLDLRPFVFVVEDRNETRTMFESLMEVSYQFIGVFIVFGASIGTFAVFNTVTLNVFERSRELATMRTLGFSRLQVDTLLTVENLIVGVTGVVMGFVLGYLMELYLLTEFAADNFALEVFVSPMTFIVIGFAAVVVLLISQVPAMRSIHGTDLAAATKERGT